MLRSIFLLFVAAYACRRAPSPWSLARRNNARYLPRYPGTEACIKCTSRPNSNGSGHTPYNIMELLGRP